MKQIGETLTTESNSELRSDTSPIWRYALYLEDIDGVACRAVETPDFFEDMSRTARREFTLLGVSPADQKWWEALTVKRKRDILGNGELWILDSTGRRIGSYFIAGIGIRALPPTARTEATPLRNGLIVTGHVLDPPYRHTRALWDLWRSGGPTTKNRWKELPTGDLDAWLEVAAKAQQENSSKDSTAGKIFTLDGAGIHTREGIYCALGEAINGPGGYFGRDLDSLADCLRGGFGATTPFTLAWQFFDALPKFIDNHYRDQIVDILTCASVTVRKQ